jgi:hypothetical protein
MSNPRNKGMCRKCINSGTIEVRPGEKQLYCKKYNKVCQRVAWNCAR